MDRKIRVGAVSYLNTKPLVYGLELGMMSESLELFFDYPSKIAAALLNDEIDMGLVPVAIIPKMKDHYIVSDYCISSDGEVSSVCLFSEVPVKEIKTVLLDYQSTTSIELAQILLKEYWQVNPVFEIAGPDFRNHISGNTAAVVIGDRAFEQKKISRYSYDLGSAWKALTGQPFVFAAWVSNKPIEDQFIKAFNAANEFGLEHIEEVVRQNPYDLFDLGQYYTKFIQYRLNVEKMEGMQNFLRKVSRRSVKQIPFL